MSISPKNKEIGRVLNYISKKEKELSRIRSELAASKDLAPLQPENGTMDIRASLLSDAASVLLSVSALVQKLGSIPSEILDKLIDYIEKFVETVSKYLHLLKIQSITLTISAPPSLQIVFAP